MAPFCRSGTAPRGEPEIGLAQFIGSLPPGGITSAAAAAAAFLRPPPFRRAATFRRPPFFAAAFFFGAAFRPAFFAAAFLRPPAFFFGAALRPAFFFGAALRPAFFAAAFLRPPARIASACARGCSVVRFSSLLTCGNSFSYRWLHRAGDPAWEVICHATNAARARKRDEPARRALAPSSSSHLRSRILCRCSIDCASPGRVCGQWTVLPLSAHRATLRIECMRTESAIPCLDRRCQQKATVSSQVR